MSSTQISGMIFWLCAWAAVALAVGRIWEVRGHGFGRGFGFGLVAGFVLMPTFAYTFDNSDFGAAFGLFLALLTGTGISLFRRRSRVPEEKEMLAKGAMKKCPFCAELIRPDARVCRYCGLDLPTEECATSNNPPRPTISAGKRWGLAAALVGIAALPPIFLAGTNVARFAWAWATFFGIVAVIAAVKPTFLLGSRAWNVPPDARDAPRQR